MQNKESYKNLQNVNSQIPQISQISPSQQTPNNTIKTKHQEHIAISKQLSFNEIMIIMEFARSSCGIKPQVANKKFQIIQKFDEKFQQETFENFQKTNDVKVFENALKSQISNKSQI